MEPTFGARLRQQREERQVTLTAISTKTKIKASLLEALESDDVSAWPKGLFGRAYLRDYATAVGLDPETVVGEFLSLHPEFAYVAPQVEQAEAAARADAARRGAAEKLLRFVSSAFSVSPRRSAGPPPRQERLETFEYHEQHQPRGAGREIVATSLSPLLAEAEERLHLAELTETAEHFTAADFREPVADPMEFELTPPAPADPAPESTGEISLPAMADVCTRLACAIDWREVAALMDDAAKLLDAGGLILWQWDARATALRPSLACGYPEAMVARLPEVRSDDANAVATAFRSGEQCVIDGAEGTEAVVVPSFGVGGCVGVLALELRPGARQREAVCAFARILAAQLAMLLPAPEPVEA